MYCKKCGKSIKDNAVFCPHCGGKIKKDEEILKFGRGSSGPTTSFLTEQEKGRANIKHFAGKLQEKDKKKVIGVICGAVVFAAICIVLLAMKKEPEYSVVGEWSSEDLSNLGSIMEEAVGGGIVGEAVCYFIGDALGEATVTFSESGQVYISFYDMSVSIGKLTYDIISSNRMRLAYEIEIPVIGNAVTASYNATFKVKKDTMTLDFFGVEITLDRVEED